jgi:hypothetical protein
MKAIATLKNLAVITAAVGGAMTLAPSAEAFTVGGGISGSLSLGCPASQCVNLGAAGYTVTGGGVTSGSNQPYAENPGSHYGDEAKVTSYSITSGENVPVGAITDIVVSNLVNKFSFYWGSVDTHNKLSFFSGNSLMATLTGQQLAGTTDWSALGLNTVANRSGNYREDVYVNFAGIFDKVVLSTTPFRYHDGTKDGVAFEVAAVPEPGTLLMVGGALALAGKMKQRRQADA